MKNRRSTQIASIILALGMLTTYVVYSQRQPARSVAPSSKLILMDEFKQWGTSGNFGTYRCPPHEPEALGVSEPMPQKYLSQLMHPFRRRRPSSES